MEIDEQLRESLNFTSSTGSIKNDERVHVKRWRHGVGGRARAATMREGSLSRSSEQLYTPNKFAVLHCYDRHASGTITYISSSGTKREDMASTVTVEKMRH